MGFILYPIDIYTFFFPASYWVKVHNLPKWLIGHKYRRFI